MDGRPAHRSLQKGANEWRAARAEAELRKEQIDVEITEEEKR